jgi:hypothetical protein
MTDIYYKEPSYQNKENVTMTLHLRRTLGTPLYFAHSRRLGTKEEMLETTMDLRE